jgi:hypothetical protein
MTKKYVVYTTLFGSYEKLNELEISEECNVDRIVLTDCEHLQSNTWQIHYVNPDFPGDSVRSQRVVKLKRPEFIRNNYEASLYVDNTVQLKTNVTKVIDFWLDGVDLAIPYHSFRNRLEDEFIEVSNNKLDSGERLEEQLENYNTFHANMLNECVYWTGILARRNSFDLDRFEDAWRDQVLRYSRRDQLSVNLALKNSQVSHRGVSIDNHSSEFHSWPILNNRLQHIRGAPSPDYKSKLDLVKNELDLVKNELDLAKNELDLVKTELSVLQSEIDRLLKLVFSLNHSYSFKLTRPLRFFHRNARKLCTMLRKGN